MSLVYNAWRSTTLKIYDSVNGLQTVADHTTYTMWTAALAVGDYIYFENGGWYDTPPQNIRLEVGTTLGVTSASFELQYQNTSGAWIKIDDVASTVFTTAGQTTITWSVKDFVDWNNQGVIRIVCTAVDTPTQACVSATTETVTGDGQFYISGSTHDVEDMRAVSTTEEAVLRTQYASGNRVYEVRAIITLDRSVADSVWQENDVEKTIAMISCNKNSRGVISWRTKNSGNTAYVKFGKLTNKATEYGVNYIRWQDGSTYGSLMSHNATYCLYGSSIKEKSLASNGVEGQDSVVKCTGRFTGRFIDASNITFTNQDRIESHLLDLTITGTNTTALTTLFYEQVWKRCKLTNLNVKKHYDNYRSTFLIDCEYTDGQLHSGSERMYVYEGYTHFIKVEDQNGNAISGATITCTDGTGNAQNITDWANGMWDKGGYTVTTNDDGYAGLWHGTASGGGSDYIEDTNSTPWAWNVSYGERKGRTAQFTILITSGTGAGQIRDIHGTGSATSSKMYVTQDWDTNPDNTSKYVMFPFITRRLWSSTSPTNLYPFTIGVTKTGYDNYSICTNKDFTAQLGTAENPYIVRMTASGGGGISSAYIN